MPNYSLKLQVVFYGGLHNRHSDNVTRTLKKMQSDNDFAFTVVRWHVDGQLIY